MWITFATAAGGVLSIAKAVHIFWQMRQDKKHDEIKRAVAKFAENVSHLPESEDPDKYKEQFFRKKSGRD